MSSKYCSAFNAACSFQSAPDWSTPYTDSWCVNPSYSSCLINPFREKGMNLKYSNAFLAAFFSPIVAESSFKVGAGVDTVLVGAGVDTVLVGVGVDTSSAGDGFEVHPAIPTVVSMSKPITRKMPIFS